MPAVYLVRHGQASFGSSNYDVLSQTGRRQAELAGAALADRRPTWIVAGTLARQRDSAELLAPVAGISNPLESDARWNEYDHTAMLTRHAGRFGALTTGVRAVLGNGQAVQAALDSALHEWITSGSDWSDGMTWNQFCTGAMMALNDVLNTSPAVVVTSGGVVAAVCTQLLGLGADGFVALNRVSVNTGITTVVRGKSGTSLLSFNEHAHLAGTDLLTYR